MFRSYKVSFLFCFAVFYSTLTSPAIPQGICNTNNHYDRAAASIVRDSYGSQLNHCRTSKLYCGQFPDDIWASGNGPPIREYGQSLLRWVPYQCWSIGDWSLTNRVANYRNCGGKDLSDTFVKVGLARTISECGLCPSGAGEFFEEAGFEGLTTSQKSGLARCGISEQSSCDELYSKNVSELSSADRASLASSCGCDVGNAGLSPREERERSRRQYLDLSERNTPWNPSCVVEKLCEFDPSIVDWLREGSVANGSGPNNDGTQIGIPISRVRGLINYQSKFQNGEWQTYSTPMGGMTYECSERDQRGCTPEIGIDINHFYNCEEAAKAIVHETTHTKQFDQNNRNIVDFDWRAWELEADLEGRRFLETSGQMVESAECTAYKREQNTNDYPFGNRDGERVIGRRPGQALVERVDDSGSTTIEWVEAAEGDAYQSGVRITEGTRRFIDTNLLRCQ